MKWAKPIMALHTKNPKPKTKKIIFFADWKSCRVNWGFEHLFRATGRGAMDLPRHVQTAWFRPAV